LESVRREEEVDYKAQKEMEKTNGLMRFSIYIAFFLTPIVFYLIGTLILDMGVITDRVEEMAHDTTKMRGNFDQVTQLIGAMDNSVLQISHSIEVIPPMAERVGGMDNDVHLMVGAMNGITQNIQQVDVLMSAMDYDMAQMNGAFGRLNLNVFRMGHDVHTLSNPMRMIPFFSR
jgi:methyl-accepting chemotaxis protein